MKHTEEQILEKAKKVLQDLEFRKRILQRRKH